MDSPALSKTSLAANVDPKKTTSEIDARLIREASLSILENRTQRGAEDSSSISMDGVYKSLTVLGDEVVKKLNELLGESTPGGTQALKPEEHTPEATADRIFQGVMGFLPAYEKQNPNLKGQELIDSFVAEVSKGIESGYSSAKQTLGEIGALKFEGVEAGIEKTMSLLREKLEKFRTSYLSPPITEAPQPAPDRGPGLGLGLGQGSENANENATPGQNSPPPPFSISA